MEQQLIPARIVTPGRILIRELDARGWTQKDLAEIMGRPPQTINEIIKGNKQITPETAIELSKALGTTPNFWVNLETNYRLNLAKKQKSDSDIERRSRLYSLAPISELIKRQWLPPLDSSNIDELERVVCQFLEIESPQENPTFTVNFRHNGQLNPENAALIAWIKRVEFLAKQQTVANFSLDSLKTAIPQILSYSDSAEKISQLPLLFQELGIHFVIVPHLSKTYLDGAVFYLGENPVIALTLRYNRIDAFWFTLMHEIAHVYLGHQGRYLDNLESLPDNEEENKANQLACDWLIEPNALNTFINHHKPKFSGKAIANFAQTHHRHPGIIVGRLQHDGWVDFKNLRKYLVKVHHFLE